MTGASYDPVTGQNRRDPRTTLADGTPRPAPGETSAMIAGLERQHAALVAEHEWLRRAVTDSGREITEGGGLSFWSDEASGTVRYRRGDREFVLHLEERYPA